MMDGNNAVQILFRPMQSAEAVFEVPFRTCRKFCTIVQSSQIAFKRYTFERGAKG